MASGEAISTLLTRLRRVRGWSQSDLAGQLADASQSATVTRNEVSRWERGERVPSAYWVRWIANVSGLPLVDVQEAAATSRVLRKRLPVPGLALPEIVPDTDLSDRLAGTIEQPDRVDDVSIDWLTTCLVQHRRAEDTLGAQALQGVARAQLDVVATLTRQTQERRRKRLVDLASQYAQFLGWMGVAMDDKAAAGAWYGRAKTWADEAGNANMAATALSMQAHQAWGAGDARRCLELADAARGYEGRISLGLQGMAAQTAARGHALVGNVERARSNLEQAADLLLRASDPAHTEPDWLYFYDNNWLIRQRGTVELQLGNYSLAADLLSAGIAAISPNYRRDHAWIGGCLALAYAASGQSEAAVSTATDVATDAVALSKYGLEKLHEAAGALHTIDPKRALMIRDAIRAA